MAECRRIVRAFSDSMGDMNPDLLNYKIREAVLSGDDLTDDLAVAAARHICKNAAKEMPWMGKTARTAGKGACGHLLFLLDMDEVSDGAIAAMDKVLAAGAGAKDEERRRRIVEAIPMLPEGYREAAQMAETLPDTEVLAGMSDRIDRMIHGTVSKELYGLCMEYEAERHANHIITLSDMLVRSAALVKEHPEVRRKLHDRYKVFFVDEYQDTNPVQTELIFAIAADQYDPDWHLSVPGAGRLFLVGDAKQGIYRFTGADISLWQEAEEVIRRTGGEVVPLNRNFRSTPEICAAVSQTFGPGGDLEMTDDGFQVEFRDMVAVRDSVPDAIYHHVIPCYEDGSLPGDDEESAMLLDPHWEAAEQVALYIRDRVDSGGKEFGDFLVISFNKEKHDQYSEVFRRFRIPVKYDGVLPMTAYHPLQLLNLRVQAICHPFDERLSVRVLCECGDVLPQEWDLFRMNLKKLPPDSGLGKFRDPRNLMNHTEELWRLLPDTPMNRNILKALRMLNGDRKLSQHREPCAFLDELVENSEGLYREAYDAEEYQNQYAALRHVIDSIREKNPQQFDEMAELLQAIVESSLERMPTVRADSNYVRLMNLHKVKGLEGKIVIYLPDRLHQVQADHYILREGTGSRGWFPLKSEGRGTSYNPPDWKEHSKTETSFQKAERTRLRYVALTRAAEEVHFFDYLVNPASKARNELAWKGFEGIGENMPALQVDPEGAETEREGEAEETVRAERQGVLAGLPAVKEKHASRKTPSTVDKEYSDAGQFRVQNAEDADPTENDPEEAADPEDTPGGKDWGSAVHRAAELAVTGGVFTVEAIRAAAKQAVTEQFDSELLGLQLRKSLQLPAEKVSLEDIRAWLAEKIADKLSFMTDGTSSFRKGLENAEVHAEIPFVISVSPTDGQVYYSLAGLMNITGGRRAEVHGKIDLALRYPDGSWVIADYKTDRMLPEDEGNRERFENRLRREYGNQLQIYRTVLEYLTGEKVRETKLISV